MKRLPYLSIIAVLWQNKLYRSGIIRALTLVAAVCLGLYYFINVKGNEYSFTKPISRFFTKLIKGLPDTLSYETPDEWRDKGMNAVFDEEKDQYVEPSYILSNGSEKITLYRTYLDQAPITPMQEWINDFRKENTLENIKVEPQCSLGSLTGACAYINSSDTFHLVFYSNVKDDKLGFHLHATGPLKSATALQKVSQFVVNSIEINKKLEFKGY